MPDEQIILTLRILGSRVNRCSTSSLLTCWSLDGIAIPLLTLAITVNSKIINKLIFIMKFISIVESSLRISRFLLKMPFSSSNNDNQATTAAENFSFEYYKKNINGKLLRTALYIWKFSLSPVSFSSSSTSTSAANRTKSRRSQMTWRLSLTHTAHYRRWESFWKFFSRSNKKTSNKFVLREN